MMTHETSQNKSKDFEYINQKEMMKPKGNRRIISFPNITSQYKHYSVPRESREGRCRERQERDIERRRGRALKERKEGESTKGQLVNENEM